MKRPISPIVFGVVNLLLGGLGLLGFIILGVAMTVGEYEPEGFAKVAGDHPWLRWISFTRDIISALSVVVLIPSGIGLIFYREWGRRLSLGYALYAAVDIVVGTVIVVVCAPGAFDQLDRVNFIVEGIFYAVLYGLSALHAALIVYFLTRPRVKMAFVAPQLLASERFGESPFARQDFVTQGGVQDSTNPFAPPGS